MDERFWSKVNKTSTCWLWTAGVSKDGYGKYWYNKKNIRAHRYSYMVSKSEIADGLVVRHTCDVRLCVNPKHLLLGTVQDNIDDMIERGRRKVNNGEHHGNNRLTNDDIYEIKILRGFDFTNIELAKRFQVSDSLISLILSGKRWGHL